MSTPNEAIARKAAEKTLEGLEYLANYDDLENRNTAIILAAILEAMEPLLFPPRKKK
jgi:hypothetical protein